MVDYQHAGFLPTITAGVAQSPHACRRTARLVAGRQDHARLSGRRGRELGGPDVFGRVRDAVAGAQANAAASAADASQPSCRSRPARDRLFRAALARHAEAAARRHRARVRGRTDAAEAAARGQCDRRVGGCASRRSSRRRARRTPTSTHRARSSTCDCNAGRQRVDVRAAAARAVVRRAGHPARRAVATARAAADIAAAERRVAAANARIGEARAAFFPDLVLSASAGKPVRSLRRGSPRRACSGRSARSSPARCSTAAAAVRRCAARMRNTTARSPITGKPCWWRSSRSRISCRRSMRSRRRHAASSARPMRPTCRCG